MNFLTLSSCFGQDFCFGTDLGLIPRPICKKSLLFRVDGIQGPWTVFPFTSIQRPMNISRSSPLLGSLHLRWTSQCQGELMGTLATSFWRWDCWDLATHGIEHTCWLTTWGNNDWIIILQSFRGIRGWHSGPFSFEVGHDYCGCPSILRDSWPSAVKR